MPAASSTPGCSTGAAGTRRSSPQHAKLPELGAARILLHDPAALLQPHRASELTSELREVSGLPVGLYAQGAGGNALAAALEAARAGADLIGTAVYPVALSLHRVSAEAAAQAFGGLGLDTGIDLDRLWEAADLVDEHLGDEPVAPLAPRIAVRAAQNKLPVGLVAALDRQLRSQAAGDRLDEVLVEVDHVRREIGSPPLAAPIGQIVASQALLNVLSANRYSTIVDELRELVLGRFGRTPAPVDPALVRAVELYDDAGEPEPVDLDSLRDEADGLASSEEELLLLALFGEEAEALLRALRERSSGDESLGAGGVDRVRAERIRELVRIVQETGVGEITIEEDGMRVSVRRTVDQPVATGAMLAPAAEPELPPILPRRRRVRPGGEPDGRHLLPCAVAGRAAVRQRRRAGRCRPDAVHPRGDEADERGQGGGRGDRARDPRAERRAGRVRPAAVRARARQRPPARRGVS